MGVGWAATEVYFSPPGGAAERLLKAINLSRTSITLAVYHLTSGELAAALRDAQRRGVKVRVVTDAQQADQQHSEIPFLYRHQVPIKVLGGGRGQGLMHHKFAVFDGHLVVTGSYNWTASAERYNHENLVVLDEPWVARRFQEEFDQLWAEGQATSKVTPYQGREGSRRRWVARDWARWVQYYQGQILIIGVSAFGGFLIGLRFRTRPKEGHLRRE
ncbi:MAG: phospholipase D family protein [Elusimicrobia bacterium]|nr:phospholipase D family protein [Elusimicrobiota bacterium]